MRVPPLVRRLKIMSGNAKMGKVMNISLPPCTSCSTTLPCFTGGRKTCYALKFYEMRRNVREAWNQNWRVWSENPSAYFQEIEEVVRKRKPDVFRYHVGGDIPSPYYLMYMCDLARNMPETKFMAFTKRYDWAWDARKTLPFNLQLVLSGWPGLTIPAEYKKHFPTAWMRDPKDPDPDIPENAVTCDGGCDKCGLCWLLRPGQSVVFDKH